MLIQHLILALLTQILDTLLQLQYTHFITLHLLLNFLHIQSCEYILIQILRNLTKLLNMSPQQSPIQICLLQFLQISISRLTNPHQLGIVNIILILIFESIKLFNFDIIQLLECLRGWCILQYEFPLIDIASRILNV